MEMDTQNLLKRVPAFVFVLATAALVVIIGIGSVYLTSGGRTHLWRPMPCRRRGHGDVPAGQPSGLRHGLGHGRAAGLPVRGRPPDVMQWMVCYCGCGDHLATKRAELLCERGRRGIRRSRLQL
jgi:hypothetical protein